MKLIFKNLKNYYRMKYFFTGLFVLATFTILAQDDLEEQLEGPIAERVRSMRVAFITDKLQLTSKQSQQFWPLYNEFEAEQKQIRQSARSTKSIANMSDEEVEQVIQRRLDSEEALLKAKKAYYQKLKSVISVRQIAMLGKAERDFRAFLLRELQKRRGKK